MQSYLIALHLTVLKGFSIGKLLIAQIVEPSIDPLICRDPQSRKLGRKIGMSSFRLSRTYVNRERK